MPPARAARPPRPEHEDAPALERVDDYWIGRFTAMASPCEVLVDGDDRDEALAACSAARLEALRIEAKFSRYRDDNIVHRIQHACGRPVEVDAETAGLLDYAARCWTESDGRFDVTSGALRRVWTFDGGDRVPDAASLRHALARVGWRRVSWRPPVLTMPEGMEIDLGGIGKEYAVDRAAGEAAARVRSAFLVNFGGDLIASGPRRGGRPWIVGVDDPERTGTAALYRIELTRGALATSGDARRFVRHGGRRLGHILDPSTGWPVEGAPRSVTVLAATCLEAGTLATLACLMGPSAEAFLREQNVEFRIA
ncbi:MAG: FAD:protein FMN transferase [Candidatus Eisenbacteria bacterium]|nr:FAD:protein FMN transferase [Candidatus Eisenbacteria bacterium]